MFGLQFTLLGNWLPFRPSSSGWNSWFHTYSPKHRPDGMITACSYLSIFLSLISCEHHVFFIHCTHICLVLIYVLSWLFTNITALSIKWTLIFPISRSLSWCTVGLIFSIYEKDQLDSRLFFEGKTVIGTFALGLFLFRVSANCLLGYRKVIICTLFSFNSMKIVRSLWTNLTQWTLN